VVRAVAPPPRVSDPVMTHRAGCGTNPRGYFGGFHGTPRSRQILRASASRTSVCRGTDDLRFRDGLAHQG